MGWTRRPAAASSHSTRTRALARQIVRGGSSGGVGAEKAQGAGQRDGRREEEEGGRKRREEGRGWRENGEEEGEERGQEEGGDLGSMDSTWVRRSWRCVNLEKSDRASGSHSFTTSIDHPPSAYSRFVAAEIKVSAPQPHWALYDTGAGTHLICPSRPVQFRAPGMPCQARGSVREVPDPDCQRWFWPCTAHSFPRPH